jgi:hypothetical protein
MDKLLSELAQLRERQKLGLEPDEDADLEEEGEEEVEGEEYVIWRLEEPASPDSPAAPTKPEAPVPNKATSTAQPSSGTPLWVSDWQDQPAGVKQGPGQQQQQQQQGASPIQPSGHTLRPQPKVRKLQGSPRTPDPSQAK